MDRLVEIRLCLEGIEAKKRELDEVQDNLVNEYNSIIRDRQAAAAEMAKTNQPAKVEEPKQENKK